MARDGTLGPAGESDDFWWHASRRGRSRHREGGTRALTGVPALPVGRVELVNDAVDFDRVAQHMYALMIRNISSDGFVFTDSTPTLLSEPGCVIAAPTPASLLHHRRSEPAVVGAGRRPGVADQRARRRVRRAVTRRAGGRQEPGRAQPRVPARRRCSSPSGPSLVLVGSATATATDVHSQPAIRTRPAASPRRRSRTRTRG